MKDERGKKEMEEPDEDEQEIYMNSPARSRGWVRAKLWRSVSSLAARHSCSSCVWEEQSTYSLHDCIGG